MKITDVTQQKRSAVRRSIFVDGEFALGVCEETYIRFALFRGREVTEEFIEEVRREDELYRCKQSALRSVGVRMRSEHELRERLLGKEFSASAIDATMAFLEEYRMLDDTSFARAYVNDRLLKRTLGRRRLEEELRRRGVAREDAGKAVAESISDDDEFNNAIATGRRKAPLIRKDDPGKWERSMTAFLSGRGFTWETINRVIKQLKEERGND